MKSTRVYVNEKFCAFRLVKYNKSCYDIRLNVTEGKGDICPLCKQKIKPDVETYIVINNYVLFPNCWVHKDCVNGEFQHSAEKMTKDYEEAKKYIYWFR
jgi:hypothetical protein